MPERVGKAHAVHAEVGRAAPFLGLGRPAVHNSHPLELLVEQLSSDGREKAHGLFKALRAAGRAHEQQFEVALTEDDDARLLLTGYRFLVHRELVNRSMDWEADELEGTFLELVDELLKARAFDRWEMH